MQNPPKKPVGLYIGIALIAIVVIAGIAFLTFIMRFMNSEEGQRMKETIFASQRIEAIIPNLTDALRSYEQANNRFPDSLEELGKYGATGETLTTAKEMMEYRKPPLDSPPETVILTTKSMDFIKGANMRVEITKDLQAYQITRAPLGQTNKPQFKKE